MLFVGTSIIHPSTEGVFLLCNILDLLIYSYEELAEKAEMSSRYLKEIENGGRVPSFHKIRKLVRALNVPPEPLFYPNNHTDNLDYQRLLMYLSKCNDEQITAILAIVEAYLRTYKIPTDHDKQDP